MRKVLVVIGVVALFACSDSSGPSVGPPASLAIVAGGAAQVGRFGEAVPITPTVLVADANNRPVPNVAVTFAIGAGGGSVASATQTTGANGSASTAWTMANTFGTKTMTATVQGLSPVVFTASAIAPDAGVLAFTLADPAGDTLPNPTGFPPTSHDLVLLRGDFKRDSLILTVTFNGPISAGSASTASIGGYLEIDIDDNSNTGYDVIANEFGATAALGIEYELDMFESDGVSLLLYNADSAAVVKASFSGNTLVVRIPMSRLSNDDGNFSLAGVVGNTERPTDIFPNTGQGLVRRGNISATSASSVRAQKSPLLNSTLGSHRWAKLRGRQR